MFECPDHSQSPLSHLIMDKTRTQPVLVRTRDRNSSDIGSVRTHRCDWRTHRTFRRQQHVTLRRAPFASVASSPVHDYIQFCSKSSECESCLLLVEPE